MNAEAFSFSLAAFPELILDFSDCFGGPNEVGSPS